MNILDLLRTRNAGRMAIIIVWSLVLIQWDEQGAAQEQPAPSSSFSNSYYQDEYSQPRRQRKRRVRPAAKAPSNEFALGLATGFPEVVAIDMYWFFSKYAGIKLHASPPLPLDIRVEMPSDLISTKKGIAVAHPAFNINFDATYGPLYGLDFMYFPMGGSWFINTGGSFRFLGLEGSAQSPAYLCSLKEAAKDPPCGDPKARLETETELKVKADAQLRSYAAHLTTGGFWYVGNSGFIQASLGIYKPFIAKELAQVYIDILAPSSAGESSDSEDVLNLVKREKEEELRKKAVDELKKFHSSILPVISVSVGIRF